MCTAMETTGRAQIGGMQVLSWRDWVSLSVCPPVGISQGSLGLHLALTQLQKKKKEVALGVGTLDSGWSLGTDWEGAPVAT